MERYNPEHYSTRQLLWLMGNWLQELGHALRPGNMPLLSEVRTVGLYETPLDV